MLMSGETACYIAGSLESVLFVKKVRLQLPLKELKESGQSKTFVQTLYQKQDICSNFMGLIIMFFSDSFKLDVI